ncbi:hypothetical protein BpHYR1_053717, partial [Brachionus plicatilis]
FVMDGVDFGPDWEKVNRLQYPILKLLNFVRGLHFNWILKYSFTEITSHCIYCINMKSFAETSMQFRGIKQIKRSYDKLLFKSDWLKI